MKIKKTKSIFLILRIEGGVVILKGRSRICVFFVVIFQVIITFQTVHCVEYDEYGYHYLIRESDGGRSIGKCCFNSEKSLYLDISYHQSFSLIFKEWKLWSQCLGKVLVINGTTSSGKTTLTNYIKKFGFNLVSADFVEEEILMENIDCVFPNKIGILKKSIDYDDLLKVLSGFLVRENKYSGCIMNLVHEFQEGIRFCSQSIKPITIKMICDRIYEKSKPYIFSGQNVVIDIVADGKVLDVKELAYSFRYYQLRVVLLYSTLEENLRKCFQRNYTSHKYDAEDFRYPSHVLRQYLNFYKLNYASNLSRNNHIIEILDANSVRRSLRKAHLFEEALLSYNQSRVVYEEGIEGWSIGNMRSLILKFQSIISGNNKICVQPRVYCNYIIIDNKLFKIRKNNLIINENWVRDIFKKIFIK